MQHHTNRSGTVLNAVIGLVGIGGLALTGCTSQLVQDLDAAAEALRDSGEFSTVHLAYEHGAEPLNRDRNLYDFSTALADDAQVDAAGRLLAESAESSGYVPDVLVDDTTWVAGFHPYWARRTTADLSADDWTDILHTARATPAQEVWVWQLDEYYAKQEVDYARKLMLRLYAATAEDGLEDFARLRATKLAAEITDVSVEFVAGTPQEPFTYETPDVTEQGLGHTVAPIEVVGPLDSQIWAARDIIDTAQRELGELATLSLRYEENTPTLEITHDGVDASCADHESFVRMVDDLLEEPSHITLTTTPAQQGSVLRYIRDIEDMDPAVATEGSSGHCDAPDPAG